jgi:drug/metabolite transporter, DME family
MARQSGIAMLVELWNNLAMARLQVLLAALCFGTTGTAQALGPGGIDPAAVGAARIACGGALLVVFARLVRRGGGMAWARGAGGVVLTGAAAVAAYQASFFAAVDDTGVAVGTIVALGSAPAITGALEWALHGRRPPARWAAATALASAGVALLALAGGGDAGISPLGVGLAVLAGGSYAAYTLASKRLLDDGHAPEAVMAALFGLGAVVLAPVLVLSGPGWLATGGGLALVLFLGVVPTAIAYVLFARGLRSLDASEAATITLAEPVTAAALGVFVLGERVTGGGAIGAVLVLGALVLLARRAGERRTAPLAAVAEPA